jgi:hypothetical protein
MFERLLASPVPTQGPLTEAEWLSETTAVACGYTMGVATRYIHASWRNSVFVMTDMTDVADRHGVEGLEHRAIRAGSRVG